MAVKEFPNTTEKRIEELKATGDLPADAHVTKSFRNDEGQRVVRVSSKEFTDEAPAPMPAVPNVPTPIVALAPTEAPAGVTSPAPVALKPAESTK